MYASGIESLLADVISAVDDFFDQWNPSTATLIEEVCGSQWRLSRKINLIWSHSMRLVGCLGLMAYQPL